MLQMAIPIKFTVTNFVAEMKCKHGISQLNCNLNSKKPIHGFDCTVIVLRLPEIND